ncbi:MAG: valine--tRNA ligase [Calditrichaceae bacterium]|nr:valine--tRNA ligase [Calditrichaceae bacterium]MBN2708644.1 valine--tRNA ligase [Calditrichaceae bacterium]RQV92020.1 MAG: valine--tRNA ligase [Calditrichota bacterium]
MTRDVPKTYDPKLVEDKWYQHWLDKKYFHAKVDPDKKPYTIVIPPPNVTSVLHMGHAYNNTLQDILIRYHRKLGYSALWLPGTDHAGIATQSVVERELAREHKTRHDLGRERFVERVWEWKNHHGAAIINQLKKIGCSCDWDRERFTMDPGLSNAVREVFIRLYNKGLIYRGLRIVNWDPASATALADDEVDHIELQGYLYHIRYRFADSEDYIVVATTRPETLLGDTAVAVAPDDEDKKHLVGKKVIIPVVNRTVEIISDEYVDKEFGSGFVKVTPAHDPNDFEIGRRHGLNNVLVLDKNACVMPVCQVFNDNQYTDEIPVPDDIAGLDRFEARQKIIEKLKALSLLEKIEKHTHAVGHSYRSKVPVEPYLSVQWFVKMKPLAEKALKVVQEKQIKFYPENRFDKTYEHWMLTIRDWCISRQLWWGHRIPVWYNDKGEMKVSAEDPSTDMDKWIQDTDVLDTWFSSQLWPFSTLGWPDETDDLKYFYPTNTLVTAPDIIFFWVARMIMAGMEFKNEIPFENVYFNGIVRDEQGRKMSKSLGNGIDPLEMIDKFSADAVRFTIVMLSSEGQDINISPKSFEMGRNFSNKIWNAFRFLHMNLNRPDTDFPKYQDSLILEDRWILSRLHKAIRDVSENIGRFRLNDALNAVYHFFWHDYCDWYLEMIKPRLYNQQSNDLKNAALAVACYVMKSSMELLHPFIPFITEEIWQTFKTGTQKSIVISDWPEFNGNLINEQAEREIQLIQDAISGIRNLRAEMEVPPGKKIPLFVEAADSTWSLILDNKNHFISLAKISEINRSDGTLNKSDAGVLVIKNVEFLIPMAELIDRDKEKVRLSKEIERLSGLEKTLISKLKNKNFIDKAPENIIENERKKLAGVQENLEKIRKNYDNLVRSN